jgi:UDP-N-acetylmuramoyl-L-alanyl-D-glutamate--2,6-diaminopimelate ligase
MEVVRAASPVVLDDTVGNPRSLHSVLATIRAIPHAGLRIAFGIRGSRGAAINRRLASALAHGLRAAGNSARLVVTASEDVAGGRDRVREEEREAVLGVLRSEGVAFDYEPALRAAVRRVLDGCGEGDLVLLLGAQGMDAAAEMAREALGNRSG